MSSGALQGKLVLVTGASRGVGAHAAAAFAACGARVVTGARSFSDATDEIPETLLPGSVAKLHLDVTDEASVARCFERIEPFGALDVLVNNAGVGTFAPVAELTRADVERTLATNTLGAFSCARHAFERMQGRGGRILNIGSIASSAALASNAAYGASKAALLPLTRSLNEEGKPHQIRATYLCLGAVYTELWHALPQFSASDMLRLEDVSEALVFLASRPLHVRVDEMSLWPPKGLL